MTSRIQQITSFFSGKWQQPLSRFVVQASLQLFVLQCVSLALGFLLNILLVRVMSLGDYGTYVYLFNLLNLLVSFCLLGADTLLVRQVPLSDVPGKQPTLKGLLTFAFAIASIGAVVTTLVSTAVLHFTGGFDNKLKIPWVLIAFPVLLLLSLTAINQACLRGFKKMAQSQLGEKIIRPLLLVLIVAFLFRSEQTSLTALIWWNVAIIGIATIFSFGFLSKSLPVGLRHSPAVFETRSWLLVASSFFAMNILYIINARVDILLLGALKGDAAVGVYNVVLKLSELIAFFLAILNFIIAPLAASLYESGDRVRLQKLLTRSAQIVLATSLPVLLVFIFFRKYLLLLFGVQFLGGQEAFVILCVGQLFNILFGSVGTLLLMSGHQRFSILSLAASLVCNVLLNLLLTPRYGITGTAIATAGSLGLWNMAMYYFVRTKLNLRTTAFGIV